MAKFQLNDTVYVASYRAEPKVTPCVITCVMAQSTSEGEELNYYTSDGVSLNSDDCFSTKEEEQTRADELAAIENKRNNDSKGE